MRRKLLFTVVLMLLLPLGANSARSKRVTLCAPYPESYPGADTYRMSIQYAVIELARQVDLEYDWKTSYANTDPKCRQFVAPDIQGKRFRTAMRSVLRPHGLSWKIRDGKVVLHRMKRRSRRGRGDRFLRKRRI